MALALTMGANAQKVTTTSSKKSTVKKTAVTKSVKTARTSTTKAKTTTSSSSQSAQTTASGKMPVIKFTTTSHDFGKVKLGESKTFEFKFTNAGDANLVVAESNVFCNCMKVTIPTEPIAPGDSSKIIMNFTGEIPGEFMKNAQIYTNCQRPMIRLNITGEVLE